MVRDLVKEAAQEAVVVDVQSPEKKGVNLDSWRPKTELGKKVKAGEITDINQIFDQGLIILESEITDALLPNTESELIMVGQSKGKFGGGKRTIWKQTQKKTCEGNKPKFTSMVVIGNKDGYVGLGVGSAKETMPAREKAVRNSKLNVIRIKRGCGSWECSCAGPHSIPFKVRGKCGSVEIEIMPAPKGSGLRIEKECQKMLQLAGIKDVYSVARGQTGSKPNLLKACFSALKQLTKVRVLPDSIGKLGIVEGKNA
ncbi:30S ribosomal protein S5 [Candidatus Woesearchaeota archaeon]|nr:30S ribosomal protein S5 [Candidatus Woesearchaeota archaeon]